MQIEDEEFIVRLLITEGNNFCDSNEGDNKIVIIASLWGNQLETDTFACSKNNLVINSELIWEADKKSIKKIKAENIPIKIDFYSISFINFQEIRTQIGHIIVPMRGIPVTTNKKSKNIKPRWYKLIGLHHEWRCKKPEISFILLITNKEDYVRENFPKISTENCSEHIPVENQDTASLLKPQNGLYINLLEDEGLLQIGNSKTDCDIFIMKLMFKKAAYLEHIVNPEETMNKLFRLHYNLLGTPTHCLLIPKGDGIYNIQEKVAIHFRSSLSSLNEYFNKFLYIPIDLYYSDVIVAHMTFKFEKLIGTMSLNTFRNLYASNDYTLERKGILNIQPVFDLPPTYAHPYIEYIFSLHYMSTAKLGNYEIVFDKPHIAEYIDNSSTALNYNTSNTIIQQKLPSILPENQHRTDQITTPKYEVKSIKSDSALMSNCKNEQIESGNSKCSKECLKVAKSVPNIDILSCHTDRRTEKLSKDNIGDTSKRFIYGIALEKIEFTENPQNGLWQISVYHSKAELPFSVINFGLTETVSNVIEFDDLELQLFFTSTSNKIFNILVSEVCIFEVFGPNCIHGSTKLDNEIILNNMKIGNYTTANLKDNTGNTIGIAYILAYLNNSNSYNIHSSQKLSKPYHNYCLELTPSINIENVIDTNKNENNSELCNSKQSLVSFPENIAYKIVEELERWKLKQEEDFLIGLKRKEIAHLAHLTIEWKKCKFEQEKKLKEKFQKCTKLADALEDVFAYTKEKGNNELENIKMKEKIKLELMQKYNIKVLELYEKMRRIKYDSQHELKTQKIKYLELEVIKNQYELKNIKLKMEVKELKQALMDIQKTQIPRDQLVGIFQDVHILSERMDELQDNKDFYKAEWTRIAREVHAMKLDELRKIEFNLKETASLGLQEIIKGE